MILPFLMDKNLPFDAEERSEEALRRLLEESYRFLFTTAEATWSASANARVAISTLI